MTALRDAIAILLEDPADVVLARSILGRTDADGIAAAVERFVTDALGAGVVACPLFTQSVGAVFVLDLDDGRRVVLKAHRIGARLGGPDSLAELIAVYRAQQHFAGAGFPCARVLVGPRPWPGGAAAVMSYLDAPPGDDAHADPTRRAMAEGVWRTVELGHGVDAAALPAPPLPVDSLYRPAHNALFDLAAPGGEWIDARARAARAVLDAHPERPLVMHTDVSAANVPVVGGAIAAVFDMDSVARIDEMLGLAGSAVHFSYTGGLLWTLPSRDEAIAFVREYLRARGRPLDDGERARLAAAAIYAMAYTARCEHSGRPGGGQMCEALRTAPADYLAV